MAKSIIAIALLSFFLLIQNNNAYETVIVGSDNWNFASTPCTHWTERSRFQHGERTVSMYEAEKNSVVQITEEDYIICNVTSPVSVNNSDGFSVVKLNQHGPSYSISGIVENCACKNNGTIAIVVITDGRPPVSTTTCHRSKIDTILYWCGIVFVVLLALDICYGVLKLLMSCCCCLLDLADK